MFSFARSQLKDIRFGACFAALEMLISVLDRANEVLDSINKLDRLVQAGGTGKARNKEQLQGRQHLKIAIETFMEQLFNSVFVHRHRDVDSDIRARCIMCLGECIAKYKTKFFENSYLKYLGWSLNDKVSHLP
jgi:cohesin complex subunit SA-1/2